METEGEYKQCARGHYYQGDQCPYCKSTRINTDSSGERTVRHDRETDFFPPTDDSQGNGRKGGTKTEIFDPAVDAPPSDETMRYGNSGGAPTQGGGIMGRTTIIGTDDAAGVAPGVGKNPNPPRRGGRKLVGWLVTYSLDPCGVDFKLYEGRNIIGQDMDCNITIHDAMVSGKHAIILFRAGRFSITDNQSTNGTFINDEDIELEPHYLKDGDVIAIGKTVLKFKTAF